MKKAETIVRYHPVSPNLMLVTLHNLDRSSVVRSQQVADIVGCFVLSTYHDTLFNCRPMTSDPFPGATKEDIFSAVDKAFDKLGSERPKANLKHSILSWLSEQFNHLSGF